MFIQSSSLFIFLFLEIPNKIERESDQTFHTVISIICAYLWCVMYFDKVLNYTTISFIGSPTQMKL